ncbi:hypothetical protein SADUNF_Sadunf19G0060500 [Salix dunnii]|uniref:Uncharacterized protein n=1 Tax=Salix dunnii TaxID=1413687 RepID=A0A835J5R5_9ROSI|nr:hypothetical protein SADUNF_Sadunf19G0060500 [Salix dunnii]
MTTGRINHVAFLGDNTTRRSPLKIPAAGRERRGVNLIEHKRLKGGRRRRPPPASRSHPKAAIARGRIEESAQAGARSGASSLQRPGRNEAKRDTFTFEFHRSGYATQEPRRAASPVGPADTDNPMTTHAPPRTRNNNPDERTTAA